MKRLLTLITLLLIFGTFAAAQKTKVPVCNGFNTAGAPIDTTTNSTVCTDYFGVANWAFSPLPAGQITGFTLISPGSGYVNPQVVISDITGAGATATATVDSTGAVTGVTGSGTNYTMPMVTIVDVGAGGVIGAPTCGGAGQPVCGSGAMATAIIGPPFNGGMLKFQDTLPDLKNAIATPDTATFSRLGLLHHRTHPISSADAREPAADNSARVLPAREQCSDDMHEPILSRPRYPGGQRSASARSIQESPAHGSWREPVHSR